MQGWKYCQHRVFDGTVCALKWIFLSLAGGSKDLVSMKKLLVGKENWTCIKEVLGWTLDTEAGTVTLTEHNPWELLTLVDIPATQCQMVRRYLKCLVGNICSLYLAVTGAMAHLFHI